MKNPGKIIQIVKYRAAGMASILLIMFTLMLACEEENGPSGYNPPADHTISQEGYMHKSGLDNPLANCVDCHGADLKGGSVGVSCYECHGKQW